MGWTPRTPAACRGAAACGFLSRNPHSHSTPRAAGRGRHCPLHATVVSLIAIITVNGCDDSDLRLGAHDER